MAHQLKRGAIAILIAGLTTFALSLVTPELLYVVESSVDVYVWAVYQTSDFFAPVSPGLGVVVVTVSAALSAILLVWASKMVVTLVRRVLRKRS